jgi:hypothetical protein
MEVVKMSSSRKPVVASLALAVGLILIGLTGCTGNSLDDADAAHVVPSLLSFDSPAVTADTATGGGCLLTVIDWSVSLSADPINSLAGSPFNDIVMVSADMIYVWDNPALITPPRSIGLGSVSIPVLATASITFSPIGFTDLLVPGFDGESAVVNVTFRGQTVEGTPVTLQTSKQLLVESCP